jgi:DNA-binding NtrC family response regulator
MDELFRRSWPGNIRELRNVVLRAMVLAGGEAVRRQDLLAALDGGDQVLPEAAPMLVPLPGPATAGAEPDSARPEEPAVVIPAAPRGETRLDVLRRMLAEQGSVTNQDYVSLARISARTGLRDLTMLVEQGVIIRDGKRRAARYRLAGATGRPHLLSKLPEERPSAADGG